MTELEAVQAHVDGDHPLLDCQECPVCQWVLAQHQQSEVPA